MKSIKELFILGFLLLVFMCFSCKDNVIEEDDDDYGSCDIVMNDGKIQKPKWLKLIADSISNIYASKYPPYTIFAEYVPNTFTVKHDDQDYILVRDNLCASIPLGYLFVSCSGKNVVPESDLWWDLMDEILSCGIKHADDKIQSPQWLVLAIDSVANCYSPKGVWTPFVYALPYKEQDYVLLKDGVNASFFKGFIFFTCYGKKVVPESDLWHELWNEYQIKYDKLLLIWISYIN
jgi:hypothetical protein